MKPSLSMSIAALLWSTFPLAVASGVTSYNYAALYCLGIGISSLAHYGYLRWRGIDPLAVLRRNPRTVLAWGGSAAASITLASFLYYYAMTADDKIESAVLLELWPVASMMFGWLLIRRMSWQQMPAYAWPCAALAFLGSALLVVDRTGVAEGLSLDRYNVLAFFGALFYGLSGNMQAVLGERFDGHDEFDKTALSRFFADTGSFGLAVVATPFLSITPDLDRGFLLSALYLGIVIYSLSAFFFNHALRTASSPSINLLFYFSPVIAVFWLGLSGYGDITRFALFGVTSILVANAVASSEYRYAPSSAYTLFFVLASGVVVAFYDGFALGPQLFYMQMAAGIFAIIAGFSLTRLHQRNDQEELCRLRISSHAYRLVQLGRGLPREVELRADVDELLTALVDYEFCKDRLESAAILARVQAFEERLHELVHGEASAPEDRRAGEAVGALFEEIDTWLQHKADEISRGELLSIVLVGLVPVIGLSFNQHENFFASIASIFIASSIVFIVLKILDLNRGQPEQDFTALLAGQQVFRRLGMSYYLPPWVVRNKSFPAPPEPVSFRQRSGAPPPEEIVCFEAESAVVRHMGGVLFVIAFLALGLVLLDKYQRIDLTRLL